jgi:hypothetical protein
MAGGGLAYNFKLEYWNMGIWECWGISPLEGHALSWPDATERVPPVMNLQ